MLTKKPNSLQQSNIFNLELHVVTVSDLIGFNKMPKISANQWGPISVNSPEICVTLSYEPNQPNKKQVGILGHLAKLLISGTGSDVEFIVKGKTIPAHSLILRGESPVFTAMFEHDMTESSSRTVVVEDIEPNVFYQLLRYLYSGEMPQEEDDENMAELLFIAANKYQVEKLKDLCIPLLTKALN